MCHNKVNQGWYLCAYAHVNCNIVLSSSYYCQQHRPHSLAASCGLRRQNSTLIPISTFSLRSNKIPCSLTICWNYREIIKANFCEIRNLGWEVGTNTYKQLNLDLWYLLLTLLWTFTCLFYMVLFIVDLVGCF